MRREQHSLSYSHSGSDDPEAHRNRYTQGRRHGSWGPWHHFDAKNSPLPAAAANEEISPALEQERSDVTFMLPVHDDGADPKIPTTESLA
jgi:hypothetical protein